jgi:hypothetical protein
MKKKLFMILMALTVSVGAFAQFEQGKKYLSASISGMDLHFTGAEKWKFDIGGRVGYMIEENWMLTCILGFSYRKNLPNTFTLGAGGRYYISANGLFLGAGLNYEHHGVGDTKVDDFVPNIHVGYAFFVSRTVTIEPEFYYKQSLKDHSNYSDVGIRIGVGVYL